MIDRDVTYLALAFVANVAQRPDGDPKTLAVPYALQYPCGSDEGPEREYVRYRRTCATALPEPASGAVFSFSHLPITLALHRISRARLGKDVYYSLSILPQELEQRCSAFA